MLDGWWVEGYKEGAGWALPMETVFSDPQYQNELDAERIYNTTLFRSVCPFFVDAPSSEISVAFQIFDFSRLIENLEV